MRVLSKSKLLAFRQCRKRFWGELVDVKALGLDKAYLRSRELLGYGEAIFEGGYAACGASIFADVLLPAGTRDAPAWRMVEMKSATTVKEYHRDDAAIQAFVARQAGLPLQSIAIAYVDTSWTYPGREDYRGLFLEEDLTAETWRERRRFEVGSPALRRSSVRESSRRYPRGVTAMSPYCCSA
jgi:hypothetical protein